MLTDRQLQALKPKTKPYRVADTGSGLSLFVQVFPNGSKLWRYRYRWQGKQQTHALGRYPDVKLAEARLKAAEARDTLASGKSPGIERQIAQMHVQTAAANTYEVVAREWVGKMKVQLSDITLDKYVTWLEGDVFPVIGRLPIDRLEAADLLPVLHRFENRGALGSAIRAWGVMGRVFRYGVGRRLCRRDPTRDITLSETIIPPPEQHFASITEPEAIGKLLKAIDGYSGSFVVLAALKLSPLVMLRPGELRAGEWSEVDLDATIWTVKAERMKMRVKHYVPLPRQAVAILRELHRLTGDGKLMFPGERSRERCISENTVNAALRKLDYTKEQMTGHGFRSMASTRLHEMGWSHDAIERQLAHSDRNKVSAAYNYAQHLPVRTEMLQAWADHLDELKAE